jgi:hypothetical protein
LRQLLSDAGDGARQQTAIVIRPLTGAVACRFDGLEASG